eukprot:6186106-Pleurochrysis_carterae.AAC.1
MYCFVCTCFSKHPLCIGVELCGLHFLAMGGWTTYRWCEAAANDDVSASRRQHATAFALGATRRRRVGNSVILAIMCTAAAAKRPSEQCGNNCSSSTGLPADLANYWLISHHVWWVSLPHDA